ncbi:MAG TPA: transglycosylase domain-containing protein, partial [Candidatus Dormibacteraeota bacterium]|nr:transglycosylase domain-containing protein [Candidatus Dormibacteraeota bacterium]
MSARHGIAGGQTVGPRPRGRTTSAGPAPVPRAARARGRRRGRWFVLSAVLLALGAGVLGAGAVWAAYSADLPSVDGFGTASLSQITRIYASDGTTLLQERYGQNRTVVPLDHISLSLQHATVAIEDRDFYRHSGFDAPRIASAAYYDFTHRAAARGASTITQQVVKNSLLAPDLAQARTADRKIKEFILAIQLENRYSKPRILEMYLNSIYYGNGAYGIEAGSQAYFGLHARDLQLPEAAFLAGIPQNPTLHDPLRPRGLASARGRQHDILKAMVAAGYLTRAEADAAYLKDLKPELDAASKQVAAPAPSLAPHFADYVLNQLRAKYGSGVVDRGGLTVITTLSPKMQQQAQTAVSKEVAAVARVTRTGRDPEDGQPAYGPNTGSMLVLSPQTGAILAMVGSADYNNKAINGAVNMTVDDPHQVGSSFKPYTYVTGIANGLTAASVLDDGNSSFVTDPTYHPRDFDGRQLGKISLAVSLQQSRNLSSIHLFEAMGAQRVFATAEALGLPPEFLKNTGPSATLGTNEVRMIDHVAAFGGFANGGRRLHAWAIARVTDSTGRVLEDNRAPHMEQAIPRDVAAQLTDILKGSEKPAGWNITFPVAMKSGTTEHWTDSWYVGYTSDLVIGAWMGHTDARGGRSHQNQIYGENGAGLILRDYIRDWYQGHAPAEMTASRTTCSTSPAPRPTAAVK